MCPFQRTFHPSEVWGRGRGGTDDVWGLLLQGVLKLWPVGATAAMSSNKAKSVSSGHKGWGAGVYVLIVLFVGLFVCMYETCFFVRSHLFPFLSLSGIG